MTGATAAPMGADPAPGPRAIDVPVAGTGDCVHLPLATLPADTGPVLDVLRAEAAPLAVWRDVARAYLAQVSKGARAAAWRAGGGACFLCRL